MDDAASFHSHLQTLLNGENPKAVVRAIEGYASLRSGPFCGGLFDEEAWTVLGQALAKNAIARRPWMAIQIVAWIQTLAVRHAELVTTKPGAFDAIADIAKDPATDGLIRQMLCEDIIGTTFNVAAAGREAIIKVTDGLHTAPMTHHEYPHNIVCLFDKNGGVMCNSGCITERPRELLDLWHDSFDDYGRTRPAYGVPVLFRTLGALYKDGTPEQQEKGGTDILAAVRYLKDLQHDLLVDIACQYLPPALTQRLG